MKTTKSHKRNRPDDAPLTAAELKTARPLAGRHLALFQAAIRRGRPAGRTKEVVSISIDHDVLKALRASGAGWQTRVNELLKAAVRVTE